MSTFIEFFAWLAIILGGIVLASAFITAATWLFGATFKSPTPRQQRRQREKLPHLTPRRKP